jgi:hypothetical protein
MMGPEPVFSVAVNTTLRALTELGMGLMPVLMDVRKIDVPARMIHTMIMISIRNMSCSLYKTWHKVAKTQMCEYQGSVFREGTQSMSGISMPIYCRIDNGGIT